jgi:hypothetical protein
MPWTRFSPTNPVTRTFNFLISPPLNKFQPNRPTAEPAFPTLDVHHEISMNYKTLSPPNEAAVFEAGYIADTLRARRDFTWAQRAAVVGLLTSTTPDPRAVVPETPQPALRSFALILARCESAATLLGWRKEITPDQKLRLDAAIHRLTEAATQVAVCAAPPEPDKRGRLFRFPIR